ncbi:MAG: glycosyltransferase, partial [Spirochaetales bacterium]|nr:glycosyltransferase [Spirochaetales bacterium]
MDVMLEAYRVADVTVISSIEDNLPNIMLESISVGTPVVGFKVGGITETVIDGKTGFTVEINDCRKLAEYIHKAIYLDLSKECRSYAINHFNSELQAKKYTEIYSELLSSDKADNRTVYTKTEFELPEPMVLFDVLNNKMQNSTEVIKNVKTKLNNDISIEKILNNSILEEQDVDKLLYIKTIRDSGLFYYTYYLSQFQNIDDLGYDPVIHYVLIGAFENKNPNPLFDNNWYKDKYLQGEDVSLNPLYHYIVQGYKLGYKPSYDFDVEQYIKENPCLYKNSNKNPLKHALTVRLERDC